MVVVVWDACFVTFPVVNIYLSTYSLSVFFSDRMPPRTTSTTTSAAPSAPPLPPPPPPPTFVDGVTDENPALQTIDPVLLFGSPNKAPRSSTSTGPRTRDDGIEAETEEEEEQDSGAVGGGGGGGGVNVGVVAAKEATTTSTSKPVSDGMLTLSRHMPTKGVAILEQLSQTFSSRMKGCYAKIVSLMMNGSSSSSSSSPPSTDVTMPEPTPLGSTLTEDGKNPRFLAINHETVPCDPARMRAQGKSMPIKFTLIRPLSAGFASAPYKRTNPLLGKAGGGGGGGAGAVVVKRLAELVVSSTTSLTHPASELQMWSFRKSGASGDKGVRDEELTWRLEAGNVVTFWLRAEDMLEDVKTYQSGKTTRFFEPTVPVSRGDHGGSSNNNNNGSDGGGGGGVVGHLGTDIEAFTLCEITLKSRCDERAREGKGFSVESVRPSSLSLYAVMADLWHRFPQTVADARARQSVCKERWAYVANELNAEDTPFLVRELQPDAVLEDVPPSSTEDASRFLMLLGAAPELPQVDIPIDVVQRYTNSTSREFAMALMDLALSVKGALSLVVVPCEYWRRSGSGCGFRAIPLVDASVLMAAVAVPFGLGGLLSAAKSRLEEVPFPASPIAYGSNLFELSQISRIVMDQIRTDAKGGWGGGDETVTIPFALGYVSSKGSSWLGPVKNNEEGGESVVLMGAFAHPSVRMRINGVEYILQVQIGLQPIAVAAGGPAPTCPEFPLSDSGVAVGLGFPVVFNLVRNVSGAPTDTAAVDLSSSAHPPFVPSVWYGYFNATPPHLALRDLLLGKADGGSGGGMAGQKRRRFPSLMPSA